MCPNNHGKNRKPEPVYNATYIKSLAKSLLKI